MKELGSDKLLMIFLMAAMIAGLTFANFYVLEPGIQKTERKIKRSKSELSKIKSDTEKLADGFALYQEQKGTFTVIQESGFFDAQNRVEARANINAMQEESGLMSARYNIRPAETITNEKLQDAGYEILRSSMEFNLEAIQDEDVYYFIHLLENGFPGQVVITDIAIKREQVITQPLLRNIGVRAKFPPLVEATVQATWQTMVPDASLTISGEEGGQE